MGSNINTGTVIFLLEDMVSLNWFLKDFVFFSPQWQNFSSCHHLKNSHNHFIKYDGMNVIVFQSNVFQMSYGAGLQFLEREEILAGFYKSEQLQMLALMCDIVINGPS